MANKLLRNLHKTETKPNTKLTQRASSRLGVKFCVSLAIFLFSFGLVTPSWVGAAKLYLEPSEVSYYQGDTFILKIRIDPGEECLNTIKADLSFPSDVLKLVDFSQGNSILTLWLEKPSINQEKGLISFAGGIPGGFCGALPGEPDRVDLLGKIIFKIEKQVVELQEIKFLESSQVLLHDGFGTPAKLSTQGTFLRVLSGVPAAPKEEWQEELEEDFSSPEPFKIEISQEPSVFEGKYFITFSTADKQTGVDYYEVKEGKGEWQRGESPYLLEDQRLTSIIKVRAVDKAGNERIAEYAPPEKPVFYYWPLALIFIAVIAWVLYQKYRNKRPRFKA